VVAGFQLEQHLEGLRVEEHYPCLLHCCGQWHRCWVIYNTLVAHR